MEPLSSTKVHPALCGNTKPSHWRSVQQKNVKFFDYFGSTTYIRIHVLPSIQKHTDASVQLCIFTLPCTLLLNYIAYQSNAHFLQNTSYQHRCRKMFCHLPLIRFWMTCLSAGYKTHMQSMSSYPSFCSLFLLCPLVNLHQRPPWKKTATIGIESCYHPTMPHVFRHSTVLIA